MDSVVRQLQTPTSPLRLLLVRHGESETNRARRMQGRLDSPLTRHGQVQAEAVARRIAAEGPLKALYASPLLRARQTAEAIGKLVALKSVLLDGLMETDIGQAMGMTWAEFEARWPRHASQIRWGMPDAGWPGGETRQQVADRVGKVVHWIVAAHSDGGTIVVVSHFGTLRWVLRHLVPATAQAEPAHRFDNCSLTEVVLGEGDPVIMCANDVAHLSEVVQARESHSSE